MPVQGPERIVVVGTSGAGKTTLARRLAKLHDVPFVELDALYWDPGWTEVSNETMRARVEAAVSGDGWVADGNYVIVRPFLWSRSTRVVWLDLPLPLLVVRLVLRTLRRMVSREVLWNGNRENLTSSVFSRESLLWWAIKTHAPRRANYERLAAEPGSPPVVRLRSSREVARWLEKETRAPSRLDRVWSAGW